MDGENVTLQQTLRDRLRVVFRRWRLLLIASTVFAIVALQAAHYVPLKYTGVARFERQSDVAEDTGVRGETFESYKLTLAHELTRYDVIARAVDELGLARRLPRDANGQLTAQGQIAMQDLIASLIIGLDIRFDVRSPRVDLVAVSFTHSDPDLAERLPNFLVKDYILRTGEEIITRLTASRDFLQEQTKDAQKRVELIEANRTRFVTEHATLFPDSPGAIQERIMRLQTSLDISRARNSEAKQHLKNLELTRKPVTQMDLTPVEVIKGPNNERKQLQRDLEQAYDELKEVYTDDHPKATAIREKIAKLEKRVADMPEEVVLQVKYATGLSGNEVLVEQTRQNSVVDMTDHEIARDEALLKQYEDLEKQIVPVRQQYMEISKLMEDAQADATRWTQRLGEIEMSLVAEKDKHRTHLNTVDLARKQTLPSAPSLTYAMLVSLGGGLAFGIALVFIAGVLDRTIATPDDAWRLFNIRVHGVVGEIVSPAQGAAGRGLKKILMILTILAILVALADSICSVVLWLQFPDRYAQWVQSPITCLRGFMGW